MADEKTVVKGQEEKNNFFTKVVNFFKKLPTAIARPFKNMWHELRKVTWPSRPDVIKYSLIVLAFLVFMGVVIALLDLGSSSLVKAITPPDKEYEEYVNNLLAQYPEGTTLDENGFPVLPEGYVFDAQGNAVTTEELLAQYPEGTTLDETGFPVLPEGYVFDKEWKAITVEELLAQYPEGTTLDENDQIILPEGYTFDNEGNAVPVETGDAAETGDTTENGDATENGDVAEDGEGSAE